MLHIQLNRFPEGKYKALTMSYDDGRIEDLKLADIFNKNGIKGTFHLCSTNLIEIFDFLVDSKAEFVPLDKIGEIYKGHEISCHTESHPFIAQLPDSAVMAEIWNNRAALEKQAGYVVRGLSHPFGSYDDRTYALYKAAGMEYARTANSTNSFGVPRDFMTWNPTCHHSGINDDLLNRFDSPMPFPAMRLLYVWGHSYEFRDADNWELIENFCSKIGGREDIWYATNIEIVDYMKALYSIRVSTDSSIVYNPSSLKLWFSVNGEPVSVNPGETIRL